MLKMQCKKCGIELTDSNMAKAAKRQKGGYFMAKTCKECKAAERRQLDQLRQEGIPSPRGFCDCCGKTSKLVLDHDHNTGKFRGWLCHSCNIGIGHLGDNIPGLIRALAYLNGSPASSNLGAK